MQKKTRQEQQLERLIRLRSDSELAIFDEVQVARDEVEEAKQEVETLREYVDNHLIGPQGEQGPKGDRGEKGEKGDRGKDGKDGRDGRNGIDGLDGIDGEKGENGKDGSPDKPEEIVKKLQTVKSPWLDAKAIKNLPQPVVNNYQSFIGRGGGASVGLETIKSAGTIVKQGASSIDFGDNLTVTQTANGVRVDASAGGGSGDVVGPASSTDNAIARFDGTTGKIIQNYISGAPTISDTGDITLGKEAAHSIVLGATTTADTVGGAMTIASGNGNGTGLGGALTINSGAGGSVSGSSGAITIQPGTVAAGNGNVGGTLNLLGRSAAGGNTSGGAIVMTAGNATSTAAGGAITITSGAATGNGAGGAISISVGNAASSSNGGSLTLTGGSCGSTSGNGGTGGLVTLTGNTGGSSSQASGTGGAGGSLTLSTGTGGSASGATSSTGGKGGSISILAKNGGTITGTGTAIGGAGGDIAITAGNGATATTGSSNTAGAGGAITFTSGNAGAAGGNVASGNITFQTGTPVGTGTVGAHIFNVNGATEISRINGTGIGLFTNAPTHSLTLGSTSTGIALYNTADQTTNYERGLIQWSGNVLNIKSEKGGTGTLREMRLISHGSLKIFGSASSSGDFAFDGSTSGAGSSNIKTITTFSASSGISTELNLATTISQSGTAGYNILLINPTESSTGSGVKRLISAQVGSVDKFVVDNTGKVTTTGGIVTRTATVTTSATPTPNADTTDLYTVTALAEAATFGAPTGTPSEGQKLMIRIKDNATARALAWNAIYRASSDLALPSTTILSKTLYLGFVYNNTDTKWDLLSVLNNF